MKFFTAASLLVAALVSAVVCVPFLPGAKDVRLYALEVTMKTAGHGRVQVFYDRGQGFAEAESSSVPVKPGSAAVVYALPLPTGTFTQLRFDPLDSDATVVVTSLRVVTRRGSVVRDIPLALPRPQNDIARVRTQEGGLEVVPTANARDPQLLVPLSPPLTLETSWLALALPRAKPIAAVFALFALALLALDRVPILRRAIQASVARLTRTPRRAVFWVAAFAVVASSYPIVFLGRSYVSPNMGTELLYEQYPVLPGYDDTQTGEVMGSDIGAIMWQHVPLSMVEARALRHGELPLWNRYNSSGTPLLGQGQSMFGDPLHFVVIATNGASWAWDLKYLIAKWLFAAGLGLIVLRVCAGGVAATDAGGTPALPAEGANDTGPTLGAALIVAAVAPFIGFFVYRFNHPAFFSVCYAPWALYCWVRAVQASSLRATAAWAGGLVISNLALMNSGTAKEAYMLLLTMNFAGACVLATATCGWRQQVKKLAVLAWAGVLFGLITAPIWGTFLHELHNAYTSYNAVSAYQIQPTLLLGAFDEIFYRPLMANGWTFSPSLNFVLLLGVLYFVATLRNQFANRTAITLAAASVLPLALAFGLVPPEWIVRVPLLANVAHIDNTFSCALIILWTVLAGVGFAHAGGRLGRREGRDDLVIVGLLLGALAFAWIAFGQVVHRPIFGPIFTVNQPGHSLPIAPFIWIYLGTLLAAAVVGMVAIRAAFRRGRLTPSLGLLVGLCAVLLCWRFGLHATAVPYERYVLRPTVRAPFHGESVAVSFLQAAQRHEPGRVYGVHSNFFPGWNDAYALETIHGPDALMNPYYRELVGGMGGVERIWDWRLYLAPENIPAARPFLDSLNVRYYVDLRSDQGLMQRALKLVRLADLDVYESPTVWPRAFFTDRVFTYAKLDELLARLRDANGHPFAAVQSSDLAPGSPLLPFTGHDGQPAVTPASDYHLTENTTAFAVHATGPGVVVLLETWWPGDFRVFVNGKKGQVLRLNHAFKGVALPAAGDYRIEFRYVPKGWYRNAALCGIGFCLLLVSSAVVWRRPKPASRPEARVPEVSQV